MIPFLVSVAFGIVVYLVVRRLAGYKPFPLFMGKVPDSEKEALKRANKQ